MFMMPSWRMALKHVLQEYQWAQWSTYMKDKDGLFYYSLFAPGPPLMQYSASEATRTMLLTLVGDTYYFAKSQQITACHRCSQELTNWIDHVLWHCTYDLLSKYRKSLCTVVEGTGYKTCSQITDRLLQLRYPQAVEFAAKMLLTWRIEN